MSTAVPGFLRTGWPWLVLPAAVFLAYSPALWNGWVWDDQALVLRDPLIRSWRLIPNAFGHFLFLDAHGSDFYRPVQRCSFLVDYALGGFEPRLFHATSVLIHTLAALALWRLGRRIARVLRASARAEVAAAWAALAWALHPLHTSAVTYVSGRADPLAALWAFLALNAMGASLQGGVGRKAIPMAGAALCFLLAALSKELGLAALGVAGLLLVLVQPPRGETLRWAGLLVVVLATYIGLRAGAERIPPPPDAPATWTERPALALAAAGEYAGLIAFPATLRMERGQERTSEGDETRFVPPSAAQLVGGIAATALAAALLLRARQRAVRLALGAALLCYLPVSNLLTLNATLAEHWLYQPLAWGLLAAAWAIVPRLRLEGFGNHVAIGALGIWIALLAARTFVRQGDWRDQRTFLVRTIAAGGSSARMWINLASLEAAANPAAAEAHFRRALALAPGQRFAVAGLARLRMDQGKFAEARQLLNSLVADEWFRGNALALRARLAVLSGSGDELEAMQRAVFHAPSHWPYRKVLFQILVARGQTLEAARALRDFLREEGFRAESWAQYSELVASIDPALSAAAMQRAGELDVHFGKSAPTREHLSSPARTREDSNLKPSDP